eukprot:scaffold139380_cov121-Phaeocystis_antarctica.AAC.1
MLLSASNGSLNKSAVAMALEASRTMRRSVRWEDCDWESWKAGETRARLDACSEGWLDAAGGEMMLKPAAAGSATSESRRCFMSI